MHATSALSNNTKQKSCSSKLSLFPHPHISVGSDSGSLWRLISERAHWFVGLGEGHVWARRRGRKSKRGQSCMYACSKLGSAASLRNPSKASAHFLHWCWRCAAGPTPLSSSVQSPNNNCYSLLKAPKKRKWGSCSDFPLKCCHFLKVEWPLGVVDWLIWERFMLNKPHKVHYR